MVDYRRLSDAELSREVADLEQRLERVDDCGYYPRAAVQRADTLAALAAARAELERRVRRVTPASASLHGSPLDGGHWWRTRGKHNARRR